MLRIRFVFIDIIQFCIISIIISCCTLANAMIPPIHQHELSLEYQKYALDDQQLEFFQNYGYLVIPQLIDANSLSILDTASKELLSELQQEMTNTPKLKLNTRFEYKGSSVLIGDSNNTIKLISWVAAAKPEFLQIGRSKELLVPIAQLLGSYEFDHIINQLHPKAKGDGMSFSLHQDLENRMYFDPDWQDINGRGSFVQMLIAIDANTKENGPLNIIPLRHDEKLHGLNPMDNAQKAEFLAKTLAERGLEEPIILTLEPGDAVLFHPLLIHFSEPNNSTTYRRAFINSASFPGANKKAYPGNGSGDRISLNATYNVF